MSRAIISLLLLMTACTAEPKPAASPEPALGGVLKVAITEPTSLDPSKMSNRASVLVASTLCEPLVVADPEDGSLHPGAAESWEIGTDAKKVTFKLRSGVKFHNGRDVVAQDYAYALSRFVHKDNGSPQRFWLEKVVGYADAVEGKAGLAGVKAPDASTLEIELSEPFAELPAVLSHPAVGSALPKEEVDKDPGAFSARPICTGPYALTGPREGTKVNLVLSEHYRPKEESVFGRGGAGFAEFIELHVVPDLEAGYRMLDEGQVDVAEVPVNNRLVDARKVEGRLYSRTDGIVSYIGLPVKRAPFDKVELRTALALALDRSSLIDTLLAGSRIMPNGFLPVSAGPAGKSGACTTNMPPRPDAAKAKDALTASGIDPAATTLKIHFNDGGSGHDRWLGVVAEQWKQALGLNSSMHPDEFKVYLDKLASGEVDGPFRLAWSIDYPSPEAFFAPIFMGGSPDNFTGYASQEFDDLMRKARGTVNEQERRDVYAQAAQVLCRDVPALVVWFGESHLAFSERVRVGGQRIDVFGFPVLRDLAVRATTSK